jgi:hypothetical protein
MNTGESLCYVDPFARAKAGVEGALDIGNVSRKANAKHRSLHFDKQIMRREIGALHEVLDAPRCPIMQESILRFSSDESNFIIRESGLDASRKKLLTIFPLSVRFFLDTCDT